MHAPTNWLLIGRHTTHICRSCPAVAESSDQALRGPVGATCIHPPRCSARGVPPMGHSRLGYLPQSYEWQEIIAQIAGGAEAEAVADATFLAAKKGLHAAS